MSIRNRRIIIRAGIALLWIGLAVLLFLGNRGHTILVDNKAAPDGSYSAVDMNVGMDGGKAVEFFKGDRDKFAVIGSRHRIRIDFVDGRQTAEKEFTVPMGTDVFLLSVPKMLAGIEPFIEPFIAERAVPRDDDDDPFSSFGSPALDPPAGALPEGALPEGALPADALPTP